MEVHKMEIIRIVSKIGDSWVIKLDKDTRKLLKITKVGQRIAVKEAENNEPPEDIKNVE